MGPYRWQRTPRRIPFFDLHSGIGLWVGFQAAGLRASAGYDEGIARVIRLHHFVSTVSHEHDDVGQHAAAALGSGAQIVAGYPRTEDQIASLIFTAGAVRPEWVVCIYPGDLGLFDIVPLLRRYDYGVTRLTVDGRLYGVLEHGNYAVIVARLLEEDDFIRDSIEARAADKPRALPVNLPQLSDIDQIRSLKGLPRRLLNGAKDIAPEDLLAELRVACPAMLAYHVGRAVLERHKAEDIPPLPEAVRADLEKLRPDVEPYVIENYLSRMRRGRRALKGRTFASSGLEVEAVIQAIAALDGTPDEFVDTGKRDVIQAMQLFGELHQTRRKPIGSLGLAAYKGLHTDLTDRAGFSVWDLVSARTIPPQPKRPRKPKKIDSATVKKLLSAPSEDFLRDYDGDDPPLDAPLPTPAAARKPRKRVLTPRKPSRKTAKTS